MNTIKIIRFQHCVSFKHTKHFKIMFIRENFFFQFFRILNGRGFGPTDRGFHEFCQNKANKCQFRSILVINDA